MGAETPEVSAIKVCMLGDVRDIIIHANFDEEFMVWRGTEFWPFLSTCSSPLQYSRTTVCVIQAEADVTRTRKIGLQRPIFRWPIFLGRILLADKNRPIS